MAASGDNRDGVDRSGLGSWLPASGIVLLAAALVFGGLVAIGDLALLRALTGFAIVAAASWIAHALRSGSEKTGVQDRQPAALPAPEVPLDTILSGLPDPVVAIDRQGHVVAFNQPAHTMAPALRRGEPASMALRTPDVVDAIRLARASGESRRVEFFERAPSNRWSEAFVTPLAGGEEGRGLVLLTFHDLSPMRRLEEMRVDFVANASHELRTPLAAVLGFIETLQGPAREDAAARERFLAIMRAQATRMARLIDDLLSLSRIELRAHLRPDTPVNLNVIVQQVVDALQTLARDRDMQVTISTAAEPLIVLGEHDELTRVFENLVENALRYGVSGKKVDITVTRGREPNGTDEARIGVRDYGPGIAAEYLPRLTERFYRVDVVESRTQGGTGLGLALVKHILNRHGGRLSIASERGAGATFTVHLPLVTGATPQTQIIK